MARKADKKAVTDGGRNTDDRIHFGRCTAVLILCGLVILIWLSMLSFSPSDPPSTIVYPNPSAVHNRVGIVGAYVAYFLRYWLGAGAYIALVFVTAWSFWMVFAKKIYEFAWRIAGLVLLVCVTSTSVYLLNPKPAEDIVAGWSGILGLSLGRFMLGRFSPTGSWVLLLVAAIIGLVLAADTLVLKLLGKIKSLWARKGDIGMVADAVKSANSSVAQKVPPVINRNQSEPVQTSVKPPTLTLFGDKKADEDKTQTPSMTNRMVSRILPPSKSQSQPAPKPASPTPQNGEFELPSVDLLIDPQGGYIESQQEYALQQQQILQQTLDNFSVQAQVEGYMTGPVITMFELSLAPGVKVSHVAGLSTDIARALAVPGVRIVSPLPGRDTIGIEVPNIEKEIVRIKELMGLAPHAADDMALPVYLGKDAEGKPIVSDLAAMPHMLIAGTTGSGKSVCINAIIMSFLLTRKPDNVKFILVDPKMVEMAAFERIPHLLCPIITDMRKAEGILDWAATKMDERYELLKEAGVRNIKSYNELGKKEIYELMGAETDEEKARIPTTLPYYVIIVDELADMMMTSGKEVESYIIRIAQKARAVGIHLVLATQRPSVNVVTGLIKSNMPCRVSFRVASRQESRIVLDQNGAEVLLGHGDMLFLAPGTSTLSRAQGTYVSDKEIRTVVKTIEKTAPQNFDTELTRLNSSSLDTEQIGQKDELFDKAVEIVLASKRGSVSLLQRRMQIGYGRASRIIDQMAEAGLLGEYKGSQAREVTITLDDWKAMQASISRDQSGASSLDGEPTSV